MQTEQIIQQILAAWRKENKIVTEFFSKHDDSFYGKEVAPGKNRAIYLLGHLIAVNDGLQPLFGLGNRLFPDYENTFLRAPDRSVEAIPSLADLKQNWETVNTTLEQHFAKMTTEDWLSRHNSVSREDFKKEPMRNKLNVILNRTSHQSYHIGQLTLMN